MQPLATGLKRVPGEVPSATGANQICYRFCAAMNRDGNRALFGCNARASYSDPPMSYDTRTVVVTGASGGVGGAVCDHLHGYRMERRGDRSPGRRIAPVRSSSTSPTARRSSAFWGRCLAWTQLVNNAALQLFRPLVETGIDEWEDVHRVNLRGPWLCVKALHRQLAARQGSVVNIASVHAVATSLSIGAYATMKGGLAAFTRAAALEFADVGVRVNTILPGAIDTPALREGFGRRADAESAPHRSHSSAPDRHDPRTSPRSWPSLSTVACRASSPAPRIPVDGGVLARLSSE